MKKIISVIILSGAFAYIFYTYFAKDYLYKIVDFKKVTGRIEICKIGDTEINKYGDEDGKFILFGNRGEYIPCVIDGDSPAESCESLISTVSSCKLVFDNISDKKVYNIISNKIIPLIKDVKTEDEQFSLEYLNKKKIEEKNTTQIRKYKNSDYEITLKNEKGIIYGSYTIKDLKNNIETNGEWIGSESNTSQLLIDDTEDTFLINVSGLIYTKNKVKHTLKITK